MRNFIIYEGKAKYQQFYKSAILKLMGNKTDTYHITYITEYTKDTLTTIKKIIGKKIFILNDTMLPVRGGSLAKKIRDMCDWDSQIILIIDKINSNLQNTLLALDYIHINNLNEKRLISTLMMAYQIQNWQKSYNFYCDKELYQIPYSDIEYFLKHLNTNQTEIVTRNKSYIISKSITKIEKDLENNFNFFKTHQSCIVNLKNVIHIDFANNTIYFKNQQIELLSRNKKKELKETLEKINDYDLI